MSDPQHTTHDDHLPLIEALVNGTIDDDGFSRLDAMLASDPQARAAYRRYVNLHTAIGDVLGQQPHLSLKLPGDTAQALTLSPDDSTLGGERFAELLASLDATEGDPPQIVDLSEQLQACARQARQARLTQRREARGQAAAYVRDVTLDAAKSPWLYAGLAALVALAVTAWALLPAGSPPAPTADHRQAAPAPAPARAVPVATLTDTHDAQWAAFKLADGDTLYAGQRLTLTEGFAEITTNRGAVALVEAPATIELTDDNALRLETGKLVGICETDSSKGFVVHTPTATVVDRGTQFGVDVGRRGATHAAVFEGQVELGERGEQPGQPTRKVRLTTGWASRVSSGGALRREPVPLSGKDHARFVRSIEQAADPVIQARRAALASEPVAYWAFDEIDDATVQSLVHAGRDGLQAFGEGGATADGPFGRALRFTGNATGRDYLLSPEPIEALVNAKQYTMSAWCKLQTRHDGRIVALYVADKTPGVMPRQAAALLVHAQPLENVIPAVPKDSARFVHRDPPGSSSRTGTNLYAQAITPGRWIHLAAVKHADRVELYVDGQLINSAREAGRIVGAPYALVGVAPQALMEDGRLSEYRPFNGLIDEVALYDRALSAREIQQLFRAYTPLLKKTSVDAQPVP